MSRSLREVVFVDGVRTPFGKAGPKGVYAETRADDLVVRVIRGLPRRNPPRPAARAAAGGRAAPRPRPAPPAPRAGPLVVRVTRALLRRNPALPADRVDEVAIAATTQVGDQGLAIGRTAAPPAGLPHSALGYA